MNRGGFRPVGLLIIWLLAACAGYAGCIMSTANVHEASSLAKSIRPAWSGQAAPIGFETLALLLLGLAAGLAGLGTWGTRAVARPRHEPIGRRWPQAKQAWRRGWQLLSARQRQLALAAGLLLTALRLVVSVRLLTVDDSASYEFFVRKSLLTVSAYYPAPNNHVFSNTISWLLYQLYPGYWWSMRLPIWLLSTAATAGWFLGLLRRSNFRVAAIAALLFSLLESSLFYAAEGRGYALLLCLSSVGFFCVLALRQAPRNSRAWVGLAVAGVMGLYTVPTFAYFLVAAYGWLGGNWLWRRQWQAVSYLAALGIATLAGATLLYVPLLWVSGAAALLNNTYVQPLGAAFWPALPAFVWELEGSLLGESHRGVLAAWHVGSVGAVGVLAGFGLLVRAARRGGLPPGQATYVLRLGVPALWFVVLPYALMLAQQVQAPTRTLWFKAAFMFVLVALETDWLLRQPRSLVRWLRPGLAVGMGAWAAIEVVQLYRSNELRLSYLDTPRQAARWLVHQPPGPILVAHAPWYLAHLQFFAHAEDPHAQLHLDGAPQPGVHYRYLITPSASSTPPQLHLDRTSNCEEINIIARW